MALFEIFRGAEEELNQVPLHEGYAYFCEDTANFFIDVSNTAGGRLQINAYAAKVLKNDTREIDIDDIFLADMVAKVTQGGTGRDTLTVNALLIGNGTNAVKMVSIDAGGIVIGDSTNGVSALKGTGALYATTSGAPKFGTLPLSAGGTNATSAADARTNLEVYSKTETDNKIDEKAVSLDYHVTIPASGWVLNGDWYTYSYANTALTCGKNGTTPPIISWESNLDEYSKIDHAEATAGTGIIFYIEEAPENDIDIVIIDVK